MGVHGLTSFIDDNPDLLKDHQLHDTALVIDGNNLYHFIYYNLNLRHQYGGDYDLFAVRTRQVFQVFLDCRIRPYVVFDGAYSRDDRKLETTLDRARKRILLADSISRGCAGKILPVLAYETFRNVLQEMGIPHVTCDQEADDQVTALANEFACPVLSNDSDFYIFDLGDGYIPLDYVSFEAISVMDESTGQKYSYLEVQKYNVENLIKTFKGITKNNLPLIATVLGNDFVDRDSFEQFFAKLHIPKGPKKKCFTNRRYHKLLRLLHWLKTMETTDDALREIVHCVKPKKQQDKVQSLIEQSINGYRNIKCDFNLKRYFEENDTDVETTDLTCFNGSEVSTWILSKFRRSELPVFMLNAVTLHRTFLLCQVENIQHPTAYDCTKRLRRIIYGILIRHDIQGPNLETRRQTMIEEYIRDVKNCQKVFLEPLLDLPSYGDLPCLNTIPLLDGFKKLQIMLESLEVGEDQVKMLSPQLKLYIASILFWLRNANPKVTVFHLQSLLVCMIYLFVKNDKSEITSKKQESRESHSEEQDGIVIDLRVAVSASTKDQLLLLEVNLEKHAREQKHTKKNPIDPDVIHGFSQLQSCLLMAKYLNQLLGNPLRDPSPAQFFNGTFLYNFCYDLKSRRCPDLFLAEMLVKRSPMAEFFQNLQLKILEVLGSPSEHFQSKPAMEKRTSKRHKSKTTLYETDSKFVVESSPCIEKKSKVTYEATCELKNKFSFLCVDD